MSGGRPCQLLAIDVYGLLAEILGDASGAIIDGGANVGKMTELLSRRFPSATVHAFEPVSASFGELSKKAEGLGPRVHAHQLALGDEAGEVDINVNKNLWTCSLLPSGNRGLEYYGDWYETVERETVRTVRLDDWADGRGINEIDLLKLDLQGFEGPALRGAERVLSRTKAIYSEAQLIAEYEGASLFGELDTFLRARGFELYQLVDLYLRGDHLEPACIDALWLRKDVLDKVRSRPVPTTLTRETNSGVEKMRAALEACAEEGLGRVALYGSGYHTVECGAALARPPVEIVSIIDDDPSRFGELWGIPVVSVDDALSRGVDAVVISTDSFEPVLFERCLGSLPARLPIVTLYRGATPTIHRRGSAAQTQEAAVA